MADFLTDRYLKLVDLEFLNITLEVDPEYYDEGQEALHAEILFAAFPRLTRIEYTMSYWFCECDFPCRILLKGKEPVGGEARYLYTADGSFCFPM